MMKVQVTSREIIKPSSPTPHHLRRFKITLLDQLIPRMYVPMLLFYSSKDGCNIETVERTQQLKKSLSETLTGYYPLAGRIREDSSIVECNDEGVDFSEARVDGRLSEFLEQPYVEVLDQMVPCNYHFAKSGLDVLLAVQVNLFNCGGMAIGVCIFHKVADGTTIATFINRWASQSHGTSDTTGPDFQSSTFFPTEGPEPLFAFVTKENVVTKRFVFDASKIAALRDRPSIDSQVGRPTRVEALTALIWRCIMRTSGEEGSVRASLAVHAVNLRGRMSPPLPDHSFGNIIFIATSVVTEKECLEDMQCYLERKLRDAIRAVNSNSIKELQKPDGISRALAAISSEVGKYVDCGIDYCYFSSWCRFPLYEVDFGWGKPAWVSIATLLLKNLVILNRTRCGDGIEAWVNMEDVHMAKFEQDQELLSFVSSPLKTG
ncbi:stemmadenine O-acetyltransferase-like [Magnolia sinica]|uniref:stemmadenine O-acetyltransferase-like n=1 Tax=Magnolia sinica TaxID=86752 RepID=UPI0026588BB1|nr:stemmadenine O-acetyltransferase-like [Magnolia sinica]